MTTAADYDAYVAQLERAGVARWAAERQASEKYPDAAREKQLEAERRENVLEKDEQREIRKLLIAFGFRVYWMSQARKSGQTRGIPDLWFAHESLPIAGWMEVKRATGGRFSEAQKTFAEDCRRAGVLYVAGDRSAARSLLMQQGLAQIAGGVLERIRRMEPVGR